MTDKEKAMQYVERFPFSNSNFQMFHKEHIVQVYLDGLAEGRKEAYELYNTEVDNIAKDYAERLKKLEQQISRMRNCFNCDNILDCILDCGQYGKERINYGGCDNWKMIEE